MRLDKFIAQSLKLTRSQAKKLIKQNAITIDGKTITDVGFKIFESTEVFYNSQKLSLGNIFQYFALNKPQNYICSTVDENYPSALNLLPSGIEGLHFAGRLDVDTVGLVLVSNDGEWTHRVRSPRKRVFKTYRVSCARVIEPRQIDILLTGVKLRSDEKPTNPAIVEKIDDFNIYLSIDEGRYHQVKRMLAAVGNHVEFLERVSIDSISIQGLELGDHRELTEKEILAFSR